eukprot:scaffold168665_cov25-Prasinocladus_malaysianus.AAC.1
MDWPPRIQSSGMELIRSTRNQLVSDVRLDITDCPNAQSKGRADCLGGLCYLFRPYPLGAVILVAKPKIQDDVHHEERVDSLQSHAMRGFTNQEDRGLATRRP